MRQQIPYHPESFGSGLITCEEQGSLLVAIDSDLACHLGRYPPEFRSVLRIRHFDEQRVVGI